MIRRTSIGEHLLFGARVFAVWMAVAFPALITWRLFSGQQAFAQMTTAQR
jgi:hypothetical protein